jgi:hypothetical protein
VKFKIINLERDKKKYARANSICSAFNLDYEIVQSVDGNDLKEQYIQEHSFKAYQCGINKTLNRILNY